MANELTLFLLSRGGPAALLLQFVPCYDVVTRLAVTCSTIRAHLHANFVLEDGVGVAGIGVDWPGAQRVGWRRFSRIFVSEHTADASELLDANPVRTLDWERDLWDPTRPHPTRTFPNVESLSISPSAHDLDRGLRIITRDAPVTPSVWHATAAQLALPFDVPRLRRLELLGNEATPPSELALVCHMNLVLFALCLDPRRLVLQQPVRELHLPSFVEPDNAVTTYAMRQLAATLEVLECQVYGSPNPTSTSWFTRVDAWPALHTLELMFQPNPRAEPTLHLHAPQLRYLKLQSETPWTADGFRDISHATRQALRELNLVHFGTDPSASPVALGFLPASLERLYLGVLGKRELVSLPPGLRVLDLYADENHTWICKDASGITLPELERFIGPPAHLDPIRTPKLREVVWHPRNSWIKLDETLNWEWETVEQRESLRDVVFVSGGWQPYPVPTVAQPWVTQVQLNIRYVFSAREREPLLESFARCTRLQSLCVTGHHDDESVAAFRSWAQARGVAFTMRSATL